MKLHSLILTLALLLAGCASDTTSADRFARVQDGQFIVDGEPYYFVGTNFWYGPILGSEGVGGDRDRLARELDALAALGVDNLRVLVGAEGPEGVTSKIEPILQPAPGEYDDALLDGLDYFMQELGKRNMKAVLYLTNSWEWSGGYSQYQMWAGDRSPAPIPSVDGYQTYVDYVAGFIPNRCALGLFADHVRFIVSRTNRYTGLKYADDPAIFSWQICNEPRPFSAENKEAFAEWIGSTARLIRSIDPNHMISTGSEGLYGCHVDMALTERIHAIPEISYVNLHIWPYNWQWVKADSMPEMMGNAITKTMEYLAPHLEFAERLGKPAVIEEFGFPRDGFVFDRGTPTALRDVYYKSVLDLVPAAKADGGILAGVNFWGWGGEARPAHLYWQRGDAYCGDPAQEQQGLYSVFDDDTTVEIIRGVNKSLR